MALATWVVSLRGVVTGVGETGSVYKIIGVELLNLFVIRGKHLAESTLLFNAPI